MRNVSVAIDPGVGHQVMEGFGGCLTTWVAQTPYLDPEFYDLLVYDLGVSVVRCPLAASFEPLNDDDDPDRFDWDKFNPDAMAPRMAFVRDFHKRGVETFTASLWSPPRWQKTNRATFHGGHLRPDMREEFAEFIAASVLTARHNWGIEFYSVSLQNELHFIEPYHSCVYSPHQIREAVRAVARKFRRDHITTRIMMPEEMGFADRLLWYIRPLMEDPETRMFPGFFCSHGGRGGIENWRTIREGLAPYGRQLWMTETGGNRQDWKGCMALARSMHDALVGGNVSAWIFWQVTHLADENGPKPGYWPAKHFFRYIRPGMVRVDASPEEGDLLASAYRTPDGRALTCVLINAGDEPVNVRGEAAAGAPDAFRVFRSSEEEKFEACGDVSGADGFELEMPPRSIVTLQGGELGGLEPAVEQRGTHGPAELTRFVPRGEEVLFHKAPRLDAAGIEALVEEGHGVNAPHLCLARPIHNAAYGRNPEAIRALVEAGADVNARDDNQMSPLMTAVQRAQPEQARALLECGADINARDYTGWTPLHYAANAGILDQVSDLLEAGADAATAATDGWTPLHAAAASPYADAVPIMRLLLESGADAAAATRDGWTPLHAAAANCLTGYRVGHTVAAREVKLLLEAGADPNAAADRGRTPLHWAAWMGHWRHGGEGLRLLVYPEAAEALIEAGAEVNAQDDDGMTPLHCAADEGYAAIAYALLAAGAGADVRDDWGRTPRNIAVVRGFTDVAEVLRTGEPPHGLEARAEESGAGGTGRAGRELREAARDGDLERVRALLQEG
ncbi:MAG: ankyrin repeat domain-containing protein, partial [Candidatus Brocadiia bacterium]